MGVSKVNEVHLHKWVSVVALIVSAVALLLAWQANQLAREANELTRESIAIGRESNRISLIDRADARTIRGWQTVPVFVYACQYASSDWFFVYSLTDIYITFINNGGHPASMTRVELAGTPYDWSITAYEDSREMTMPATILPGTERQWYFIARSPKPNQTREDATEVHAERYDMHPVLQWVFYFDDGRVLIWETQAYGSSPGLDFSRSCEELDG